MVFGIVDKLKFYVLFVGFVGDGWYKDGKVIVICYCGMV